MGHRIWRLIGLALTAFFAVSCTKWQLQGEQASNTRDPAYATVPVASGPSQAAHAKQDLAMPKQSFQMPTDTELRQRLEPLSYEVTQKDATEPPFRNRYWNHHESGLYVDIVSGEPLFSSKDKFDSGTGWPSFTAPVEMGAVQVRSDEAHGMTRTEVRSSAANSHLGHVFDDGPGPNGLRYCINSAALRFVPKDQLREAGYEKYLALFDDEVGAKVAVGATDAGGKNTCSEPAPGEAAGCRATLEDAYLAGGCFWGMQDILRKVPGVLQTEVGYMGGHTTSPTYEDVRTGKTGHAESVHVVFDPKRITFASLLKDWFFRMHDPTTSNRQGNDVGSQYRSAIFVTSSEQRQVAEAVKQQVQRSGHWKDLIVTEVADAGSFTPAEGHHQDYLVKHPGGYTCHYLR